MVGFLILIVGHVLGIVFIQIQQKLELVVILHGLAGKMGPQLAL